MLKTLRLHNFKTFLNQEVHFGPRHLLIGRNNSGKTNLCAALSFLSGTARSELAGAVSECVPGGIWEITNRALDSNQIELACTCVLDYESEVLEYAYELRLLVTTRKKGQESEIILVVQHEELRVTGPGFRDIKLLTSDGQNVQMLHEDVYLDGNKTPFVETRAPQDSTMLAKMYDLDGNRRAMHFRRYLSSVSYFSISPFAAKYQWKDVKPTYQGLSGHGHSLANALFHLKNLDERRYRRVIDFVRDTVEPGLDAINFVATPDQIPIPVVSLKDGQRASWYGLSDGTIRALAMAYLVETSNAWADSGLPTTVIIEEPENCLYPGLLGRLYDYMDDRAARVQFVFTSHSPYFINLFDTNREFVSFLRRNQDRTEVITPPPPDANDTDRELLAEEYAMELLKA